MYASLVSSVSCTTKGLIGLLAVLDVVATDAPK